MADSQ